MRIVLTGGGTAGHLMPFEPIIEALRAYHFENKNNLKKSIEPDKMEVYFLGIVNDDTKKFFSRYDIASTNIPSGKIRRYASSLTFLDLLFRLPWGMVKAIIRMWVIMPDVVVSKGGYGSVPIVFAAFFYRIPVLLHESDTIAGLANRLAARFATTIAVGFEETKKNLGKLSSKAIVTGTPVRRGFFRVDQKEARRFFGFSEDEPVLLVMGGSQGAEQINEVLLQILPALIVDMGIIHLTGKDHFTKISTVANEILASSPRKVSYKVYPYLTDTMFQAMVAADAVVSRAGGTTLAEITRLRLPALLIPLATAAADHQRKNARAYESASAARVLDPTNLTKSLFEKNLRDLMADDEVRERISNNLQFMDFPDSANVIAGLVFKLAQGLVPKAGK